MTTKTTSLNKPIHRIKIIQGHLRAIEKMISEGASITDIVLQSMAVQKALKKLDMALIKEYLQTSIVEQFQNNQIEKSVTELMKLYDMK
jgi:DNA-binding FrmR family transcriptional regulator